MINQGHRVAIVLALTEDVEEEKWAEYKDKLAQSVTPVVMLPFRLIEVREEPA